MDYSLVRVETVKDQSRVEEFVREHYLPDMPLIRAFGLEDTPPPRNPAPPRTTQLTGDICIMAQGDNGDIVGVAINRIIPASRRAAVDTPPEIKKEKQYLLQRHLQYIGDQAHVKKSRMMELMEFLEWAERAARLDTLPEQTIELRVLAVHKEWRRRGVARRLAEESVRQAREGGYQAMRMCCTSEYTARLARGLGWRQHYCLRYQDYQHAQLTLGPTHTHIYYYVTDLRKQEEEWEMVFIEDYYA